MMSQGGRHALRKIHYGVNDEHWRYFWTQKRILPYSLWLSCRWERELQLWDLLLNKNASCLTSLNSTDAIMEQKPRQTHFLAPPWSTEGYPFSCWSANPNTSSTGPLLQRQGVVLLSELTGSSGCPWATSPRGPRCLLFIVDLAGKINRRVIP